MPNGRYVVFRAQACSRNSTACRPRSSPDLGNVAELTLDDPDAPRRRSPAALAR
ncbi:hypothetical protein [Lysobacter gummosus]